MLHPHPGQCPEAFPFSQEQTVPLLLNQTPAPSSTTSLAPAPSSTTSLAPAPSSTAPSSSANQPLTKCEQVSQEAPILPNEWVWVIIAVGATSLLMNSVICVVVCCKSANKNKDAQAKSVQMKSSPVSNAGSAEASDKNVGGKKQGDDAESGKPSKTNSAEENSSPTSDKDGKQPDLERGDRSLSELARKVTANTPGKGGSTKKQGDS